MPPLKNALPVTVAAGLATVAWLPWHPAPADAEVRAARAGVAFETLSLPDAAYDQRQRPVAPALERIRPWISAVGASVGAFDLRGLGRPGDACLTDPRDDALRIFPVPGSGGPAFETFELRPQDNGLRWTAAMAPIGCVPADIDHDGRQDVLAYYWGRSPVIFRNLARAGSTPTAASFRAEELVAPMQVWNTTALNVADVDGDGRLDIAVGNYFPDGARVLDPSADDDPRMQMQHSMGKARNAGINRLYLGRPPVPGKPLVFDDVSERWPDASARSWTLALGFQDLTGNGRPELYVANDFGPDQLLVNTSTPGDVRFAEVRGTRDLTTPRSKVLGHDSFKGMGIVYSYREGQQLPRMFVSNITSPWALQESNFAFDPTGEGKDLLRGELPYRENSTEIGFAHSGWSWDLKAIDVTNSGSDFLVQATGFLQGTERMWPRLQETAMGNDQILSDPLAWLRLDEDSDLSGHEPNRLWAPVGDEFADIGDAVPFPADEVSRGFAVADVDGDDRDDVLVANQWGRSHVYLNRSTSRLPAATLYVVKDGPHGPTPVIGAMVTVTGPDYTRIAQLYPGNGHSGVSGAGLHFALPQNVLARATATVRWSEDGQVRTQRFPLRAGAQELKVG